MKNGWTWFFAILAAIGFAWAISDNKKFETLKKQFKQLLKEHKKLEKDHLTLLDEYIQSDKVENIPDVLKDQIIDLKEKYTNIDNEVEDELQTVIDLMNQNKEEIAIEKLTQVIENLLANKFIEEGHYPNKKKCPSLFNMLKKALELNWINKREFHFTSFLKEQRNEEAHELAVKFSNNWKYTSFMGGIEIIYKLKGIRRA